MDEVELQHDRVIELGVVSKDTRGAGNHLLEAIQTLMTYLVFPRTDPNGACSAHSAFGFA